MNFRQLRVIRETVTRNYNLTDVANALFTAQSGVSKHIKDLEDELGVELFVRRGKRLLGPTEAGKEAIQIVERMLLDAQNLAQLANRISKADEGTLYIAATHTQARYTLPPIIARFRAAYPKVRLALHQASPLDIPAILLEGGTDIGFATDVMEGESGVTTFPYYTWDHVVIVPEGHPLEQQNDVTLASLAVWPIITYADGITGRGRIDAAFARAGVEPEIPISVLDADVIKSCVLLGLGVGIVAEMAFDPERDRKLRRLSGPALFERNTSSIGLRRGRALRQYAYRFVEMCSPELSEAVVKKKLAGSLDD